MWIAIVMLSIAFVGLAVITMANGLMLADIIEAIKRQQKINRDIFDNADEDRAFFLERLAEVKNAKR